MWLDPLRSVEQFPAKIHDWEDEDHSVAEEEGRDIPESGKEHCVATHKGHDEAHAEGVPSGIWLPEGFMWERVATDALCCQSFSELEVCEAHDAEVDELGGSDLRMVSIWQIFVIPGQHSQD